MPRKPYNSSATVETALEVLEIIGGAKSGLTVSEISKGMQMYRSRIHRLVKSLEKKGLVSKVANDGHYVLGPTLISLGRVAHLQLNILSSARPIMVSLAKESGATVVLRVLDNDELVAIDIVESPHVLKVSYPVGTKSPFYYGACGKVLAACIPTQHLARLLAENPLLKLGPKTITKPKDFILHLRRVSRLGYAFSDEEGIEGVRSVATPIINYQGEVVAALGLGLPKHQMPLKDVPKLVKLTMEAARKISRSYQRTETGRNNNR